MLLISSTDSFPTFVFEIFEGFGIMGAFDFHISPTTESRR
jgi:hypothetical protein